MGARFSATLIAFTCFVTVLGFIQAEEKAKEKKKNLIWDAGTVQLELEKLGAGVYAFYPTDAREKI